MAEINGTILWPAGPATRETFVPGAAVVLTAKNRLHYFYATVAMAAAMTIDIVSDGFLGVGARVIVRAASDGTARTVTPTGNAIGVAQAGVINKTLVYEFELQASTAGGNVLQWVLINTRQID